MKAFFARLLPPRPLILPAAVSGVLVTLSFPATSWDWLVFVAMVPLVAAVLLVRPGRRDSFKAGFLFGFTCYVTMLWWIVKLIPSADVTIPWLMTPALVVLGLYLSVYPAFFLLLTSAATRYRSAAFVLVAPAVWTLLEVARARGELAFPWGSLGYALSDTPQLIQLAAVGGLPLLTFVVVTVNVLLGGAFALRHNIARASCVAGAAVLVSLIWWSGSRTVRGFDPGAAAPIRVAVVQPDVDLAVKWKKEFRDSTFNLIERLAFEARDAGADFIVFPETSAPVYIEVNPTYKERLQAVARAVGVPVYIGFLDHRYDGPNGEVNIYNSSGVFLPDGSVVKYDKNHLLPFGEALPGSRRWRWLRRLDFGQANFQAGPERGPIAAGPIRMTPLICFESVFPYLCARGVAGGAELFVNITNDGWFGDTPGPYQHAQMCILRAVEFRRYLVRSANTGVSMVVDPTGQVVARLGLYEEGIVVADVTPLEGLTFYARHGDWTVIVASLILAVVGWLVGRRAGATREN